MQRVPAVELGPQSTAADEVVLTVVALQQVSTLVAQHDVVLRSALDRVRPALTEGAVAPAVAENEVAAADQREVGGALQGVEQQHVTGKPKPVAVEQVGRAGPVRRARDDGVVTGQHIGVRTAPQDQLTGVLLDGERVHR